MYARVFIVGSLLIAGLFVGGYSISSRLNWITV